jgi:O-antigen/teichoic acid export membrane protein
MLVWFALNSAWVPWFYEQMNKGAYDHIRRRATQYLLGYFALISALIVSAPLLVRLLGPPEFEVSMAVVPVVMGGLFFNLPYSLFTNVEFFEKRTIYISIGTGAAAILNVVLNIWLLPVLGYVAAAWTTLVSYVALFVFHALIVRYRLRSPLQLNFWLAVLLGGVITLISALVFIATSN